MQYLKQCTSGEWKIPKQMDVVHPFKDFCIIHKKFMDVWISSQKYFARIFYEVLLAGFQCFKSNYLLILSWKKNWIRRFNQN